MIRVEKKTEYIQKLFDSIDDNSMKFKVFKGLYNSRLTGLFNLLQSGLTKYKMKKTKAFFYVEEEGDDEYVKKHKVDWEDFMWSDEEDLEKTQYKDSYNGMNKDRNMKSFMIKLRRKFKSKGKGAMNKALGGRTVHQFFNEIGIKISWGIIE